ncbi:entericidin EcnA/B family protein [Paracoccaceae bacterium Fryx2]|nr:entericidin EcnA/B family protein [Paracoccaceae bacterium Fryx2]
MKTLMMLAILATLAGCNTIDGVGRDISGGANRVGAWF